MLFQDKDIKGDSVNVEISPYVCRLGTKIQLHSNDR